MEHPEIANKFSWEPVEIDGKTFEPPAKIVFSDWVKYDVPAIYRLIAEPKNAYETYEVYIGEGTRLPQRMDNYLNADPKHKEWATERRAAGLPVKLQILLFENLTIGGKIYVQADLKSKRCRLTIERWARIENANRGFRVRNKTPL